MPLAIVVGLALYIRGGRPVTDVLRVRQQCFLERYSWCMRWRTVDVLTGMRILRRRVQLIDKWSSV